MAPKDNRRKNPPKRRKKKERREDMKIIVSASQGDIYTWAISLAIMAGVIGVIVTVSLMKGS